MARGCKTLVALGHAARMLTAIASAQQPIEPLGAAAAADAAGRRRRRDRRRARRGRRLQLRAQRVPRRVGEPTTRRRHRDLRPAAAPPTARRSAPAFQISGVDGDPPAFESRDPRSPTTRARPLRRRLRARRARSARARDLRAARQRRRARSSVHGTPRVAERASSIGSNATDQTVGHEPDVVYRPDADGDAATPRRVRRRLRRRRRRRRGDIFATGARRRRPATCSRLRPRRVRHGRRPATRTTRASRSYPGSDDLAVAWEGIAPAATREIFARRVPRHARSMRAAQDADSPTAGADRHRRATPSVTATGAGQLLGRVPCRRARRATPRSTCSRSTPALASSAATTSRSRRPGRRVAAARSASRARAPPTSRRSTATSSRGSARTPGRPGLSNDEREVMGTVLDADGASSSAPQDFTRLARRRRRRRRTSRPDRRPRVAANPPSRRWLSVWSADDARRRGRQRVRAVRPPGRRELRPRRRRLAGARRLQRRQRGRSGPARPTCSTTAWTRTARAPTR